MNARSPAGRARRVTSPSSALAAVPQCPRNGLQQPPRCFSPTGRRAGRACVTRSSVGGPVRESGGLCGRGPGVGAVLSTGGSPVLSLYFRCLSWIRRSHKGKTHLHPPGRPLVPRGRFRARGRSRPPQGGLKPAALCTAAVRVGKGGGGPRPALRPLTCCPPAVTVTVTRRSPRDLLPSRKFRSVFAAGL